MDNNDKIYVIGHKNPDTDSVCAAICYAYLKNQLDDKNYVPCRAGALNQETAFVLKTFNIEPPKLVEGMYTQVKDVEYRHMDGVKGDISLKRAWEILSESGATTLPAVDNHGFLTGVITYKDIAMSYMDILDNTVLTKAATSYNNIIDTLAGKMVVGDATKRVRPGKVLVAAANPDLMENYINKDDIVILGNRYESQLSAILMNAQCIIVCDGADVSVSITKMAEDHDCTVISSPYDTYTVARLINQSIPISFFMKTDNLITFDTEDYISDIRDVLASKRYQYYPVLDETGKYVGLLSQRNYLNANPKKVILVDHNERSQAVDGIEEVTLLEIIDHHRIGGISTMNPIYFRNQPLGCTATIIYQMFLEQGVEIPEKIAGLLCSAIISDSLLFRSPTCTKYDEEVARELARIARIDLDSYGVAMLNAGSKLKDKTDEEIFNQDYKIFTSDDIKFGVGQISAFNSSVLSNVSDRLKAYINNVFEEKEVDCIFFMLTNILTGDTNMLYFGKAADNILMHAFPDAEIDEEKIILKNCVSRKKQVIPAMVAAIHEMATL